MKEKKVVGVIGSGAMGSGIAQVAATAGHRVIIFDANDAAIKLAADIEFDGFRGQSDFSNAGVFDGNPIANASCPTFIDGIKFNF